MDDYERVLMVKPEVMVYKIPPRTTNRGYRAADWKLDTPDWVGRMKVISLGKNCFIRIEDKTSGELFAKAPVAAYPGDAVESVLDSSRYFVLRIEDESGRRAFIGVGFRDRGDSFDFNVTLQDHFKQIKKEENFEREAKSITENPGPKLDLGFKEGQTITINLGNKKEGTSRPRGRPAAAGGGAVPLLPPPGSKPGVILPPPSTSQPASSFQPQQQQFGGSDLLGLGTKNTTNPSSAGQQQSSTADWGAFTSASSNQTQSNSNWVQF